MLPSGNGFPGLEGLGKEDEGVASVDGLVQGAGVGGVQQTQIEAVGRVTLIPGPFGDPQRGDVPPGPDVEDAAEHRDGLDFGDAVVGRHGCVGNTFHNAIVKGFLQGGLGPVSLNVGKRPRRGCGDRAQACRQPCGQDQSNGRFP